jgi:homogentisate 1,2-dioxygenase
MPFYHKLGQIPPKRHTQFRKPDGTLYQEELVSTEGFSSLYSLIYHTNPPTMVKEIGASYPFGPVAAMEKNMQNRSYLTFKSTPKDDFLESRVYLLFNNDV